MTIDLRMDRLAERARGLAHSVNILVRAKGSRDLPEEAVTTIQVALGVAYWQGREDGERMALDGVRASLNDIRELLVDMGGCTDAKDRSV